jgi:hypothetical protein
MKYTIVTFVLACFLAFSMYSCKSDEPVKTITKNEIYSEIEKRLDSFMDRSVAVTSIDRIKMLAKRIDQIGASNELVLDTLPDDSKIGFKRIGGKLEFYLKDETSISQLYSVHAKESLSGAVVALELYENTRRRNCEHWRKICNDPDLNPREIDKLMCKLYIKYWCK